MESESTCSTCFLCVSESLCIVLPISLIVWCVVSASSGSVSLHSKSLVIHEFLSLSFLSGSECMNSPALVLMYL